MSLQQNLARQELNKKIHGFRESWKDAADASAPRNYLPIFKFQRLQPLKFGNC